MKERIGAISVGIVNGKHLLDLDYLEDSNADVDMNLVMTQSNQFIEFQISAEKNLFSENDLMKLKHLGEQGIKRVIEVQEKFLKGCPE